MIHLRVLARLVALVLVLGLFWVPVAVRSAKRIGSHRVVSLRLNHGFDLPVERQSAPRVEILAVVIDAALVDVEAARAVHTLPALHEDLPRTAEATPPDPLRGPPVSILA